MSDYHLELQLRHVAYGIAVRRKVFRHQVATDALCRLLAHHRPRTVETALSLFPGMMPENRETLAGLLNAIPR